MFIIFFTLFYLQQFLHFSKECHCMEQTLLGIHISSLLYFSSTHHNRQKCISQNFRQFSDS